MRQTFAGFLLCIGFGCFLTGEFLVKSVESTNDFKTEMAYLVTALLLVVLGTVVASNVPSSLQRLLRRKKT